MSSIKTQTKKIKLPNRAIKTKCLKKTHAQRKNTIYLVYYDLQSFSIETSMPVITFKHFQDADIYIANKNYEFQTLMLAARNAQQGYVLDRLRESFENEFFITVSDLVIAGEYFTREYNRKIKDIKDEEIKEKIFWECLEENIKPFRMSIIAHVSKNYK